jgi:hypothetical protein
LTGGHFELLCHFVINTLSQNLYKLLFSIYLVFYSASIFYSITAQSIFAVKPSAWARWKGILIENIIKNNKNSNNNFFDAD